MKTPKDFGIDDQHLVQIDLEGESHPHLYPPQYVVIERNSLLVGDDLGIKVASYPFESYQQNSDGSWSFASQVGNYILKQGPALND